MKEIACAGGIVVGPGQGILVILNQIGRHTFPKGTCEEGEAPIDTAIREIGEEGGIAPDRLTVVRDLGTITRLGFTAAQADVPSVVKQIAMFHCVTQQADLHPIAGDSVAAIWLPPHRLADWLTWPEELAFFEDHQHELGLRQ